jgi:hypothetical protein
MSSCACCFAFAGAIRDSLPIYGCGWKQISAHAKINSRLSCCSENEKGSLWYSDALGLGVFVCISGDPAAPKVVDPRRIVVVEPKMEGAKKPYHFGETLLLEEAERHLQKCGAVSERLALKAIRNVLEAVNARNYRIVGCAMLLAPGRALPALPKILVSHALPMRISWLVNRGFWAFVANYPK